MSHTPRTPRAVDQRRALGRRIRAYRLALGLTIADVCDRIGTSAVTIWHVDNAKADVLLGTLIDVAAAVGLDVALVADYHLPLLQLTADEVQALTAAARGFSADTYDDDTPTLRSALDKLAAAPAA